MVRRLPVRTIEVFGRYHHLIAIWGGRGLSVSARLWAVEVQISFRRWPKSRLAR